MVARVRTVAFQGLDVQDVDVQVQISNGLPAFTIVGLPDKAIAESKERVRAALHALGISLPPKRLTVNLAPADVAKEGSHYDLPIALGVLAAMEILPRDAIENDLVLGELSLDASIRPVAGVLPAAMHAVANDNRFICPAACGGEAVWAGEALDILAPSGLLQFINHVKGTQVLARPDMVHLSPANESGAVSLPDLSAVKGQETAKRALEITAAGGHNLLMVGPPGSGKSMLASCLPGILPPLDAREALAVSMIHSLSGNLPEGGLVKTRPFRDPHHSASQPSMIGGGQKAKPGEISLAHHGVLFLDELPEWGCATLEALRQPLETGQALVSRVNSHVTYPARFQLIAAMNPCKCGFLGDEGRECTRAPRCGVDYQAKISGPLLDRIDLQVDVPAVSIADLYSTAESESSAQVAVRVAKAREIQRLRFEAHYGGGENLPVDAPVNAYAKPDMLEKIAPMVVDAREILNQAAERLRLSARGYHRLIRVSRTIADLAGVEGEVQKIHVAEALGYRRGV
jgi:magnesium chelatase family protein